MLIEFFACFREGCFRDIWINLFRKYIIQRIAQLFECADLSLRALRKRFQFLLAVIVYNNLPPLSVFPLDDVTDILPILCVDKLFYVGRCVNLNGFTRDVYVFWQSCDSFSEFLIRFRIA